MAHQLWPFGITIGPHQAHGCFLSHYLLSANGSSISLLALEILKE